MTTAFKSHRSTRILRASTKALADPNNTPWGDNDSGGAAFFEQVVNRFYKEEFGLGGFQTQRLIDVTVIDAAGKRRVGHDDVVSAGLVEAFAEGVLVIDMGLVDTVHHEIHQPQTDHGAVDVITPQAFI